MNRASFAICSRVDTVKMVLCDVLLLMHKVTGAKQIRCSIHLHTIKA